MQGSFCWSSSEWNRIRPQPWTACVTEKWVRPEAQACILDTLSCDCRNKCRQLSDSSRGFWRILVGKCSDPVMPLHSTYRTAWWCGCQQSRAPAHWKLLTHSFVIFLRQSGKVDHVLLNRKIFSYSSKNFWSPFIRSVICCALFRLKKGFFGGSPGSCILWQTQTLPLKHKPWHRSFFRHEKHSKWAYMSIEFSRSLCLSHTNSLYLLLTLEIFLVKHTLLVWNRLQKLLQETLILDHRDLKNLPLSFSFYLHASKFHSPCRHARSHSFVSVGPEPRHWWPAAWIEKTGETLKSYEKRRSL